MRQLQQFILSLYVLEQHICKLNGEQLRFLIWELSCHKILPVPGTEYKTGGVSERLRRAYVQSTNRLSGNGEFEGVLRTIHGIFKALSEHMPGGTEENQNINSM
jgi:hypothetical protein